MLYSATHGLLKLNGNCYGLSKSLLPTFRTLKELATLASMSTPRSFSVKRTDESQTIRFEQYAENDTSEYGAVGHDPFHDQFADFD